MIKGLQKQKVCMLVTLVILLLLTTCCALYGVVSADEAKTIQSIDYYSHEVLIAGEEVNFTAKVTFTDGTTEDRPIHYTDFPVNKMHNLFHDFNVRGYVDGSDEVINQTIIVMPANVVYMVNFGSNLTDVDYTYASEGLLGKELDPTGETSLTDPYNQAILRKFPNMLNKVGAKQYGKGTPSEAGDWGYVGSDFSTQKVTGSVENTGRNVFKHLIFLKRGSGKDMTIKLALPAESKNYDVHFGFYSYWFARSINIDLNGTEIKEKYSVSPSENVFTQKNTALSGETTIFLEAYDRVDAYAQALSSFICITDADTTKYATASAPTCTDVLDLTDTEMEVSGLTANTVLQVYDYDTQYLLYEHKVGDGETSYTVPLEGLPLDGVSRIGVCCSNVGGMGNTTVVRRTDVENFTIDYTKDYVGEDLKVSLSAYAKSKIVALRVYKDGELVMSKAVDSIASWQDFVYLSENGKYRFELESGSGGIGVEEVEITNIDNGETALTLVFNKDTVSKSTSESVALKIQTLTVADIVEKGYVYGGEKNALAIDGEDITLTKSGDYTIYFINSLNKIGAQRIRFATSLDTSVTAKIEIDSSARFKKIKIASQNDYEISSVTVYGNIGGDTEKMIVNGTENDFDFTVYKDGNYFAEITTKDGFKEFVVICVTSTTTEETGSTGCGSKSASVFSTLATLLAGGFGIVLSKKFCIK